ncbi:DUF2619 domain-containing protein [Desulfuribacillus alkaliarsenatis]|nr:DUF2619 domain-containing protein [Desulfuribacillus alkaliarsenatis]
MEKIVLGMGALRLFSGTIEVIAAILIIYLGTVERAMMINAGLAVLGPTVLILVTTLGLFGLAGKISLVKFALIFIGVLFILAGLLK